jgi:NTP pyrophosphatase (non-canonical NTP hydrolase)
MIPYAFINLSNVTVIDDWIDTADNIYLQQPLAQDWARISKIAEETGEAIQSFVGATGQNPRKGVVNDMDDVTGELADVVWTAILAIQHFTKDIYQTARLIEERRTRLVSRLPG